MEKIRFLIILILIHNTAFATKDPLASLYEIKKIKNSKANDQASVISLGRVSMDLLFLLHPRMKEYNFAVDSFFKEIPKKLSVPIEFYLKDRHKKFKKFKSLQYQKSQQMKADIAEIKKQKDLLRQEYLSSNNSLLNSNESKANIGTKYQKIEQNYWSKRINYETQIKQIKSSYNAWISNNSKDLFIDRKSRNKLLSQIVNEIKSTVKEVAKSKSIQIVINRNAKSLRGENSKVKLLQKPFIPMNNNPLKDFLNDQLLFNYTDVGTTRQYFHTFESHLKNYQSIESIFSNVYEKFDTLGTVKDLTLPCLNLLFERYKYPKPVKSKLLKILQSWQKS